MTTHVKLSLVKKMSRAARLKAVQECALAVLATVSDDPVYRHKASRVLRKLLKAAT